MIKFKNILNEIKITSSHDSYRITESGMKFVRKFDQMYKLLEFFDFDLHGDDEHGIFDVDSNFGTAQMLRYTVELGPRFTLEKFLQDVPAVEEDFEYLLEKGYIK